MLKVPHSDRTVKNLIDLPKMRLSGFKITLDSRKIVFKAIWRRPSRRCMGVTITLQLRSLYQA